MKIGYIRVSTKEQNTARQEVMMDNVDKVFIDKMSGKDKNRPQLKAMLEFVRVGDTVVVESFSRLARNTRDLLEITDTLTEKGVEFVSQKEHIDTNTPVGKALLTILGAISQLERDYMLERQKEGIAIRKANGGYAGRKRIEVDREKLNEVYQIWRNGEITAKEAMIRLGVKANTFYRRIAEIKRTAPKMVPCEGNVDTPLWER